MIQIICTLVLFLLILFPVGNYIYHISAGKKTWADPLFDRVDNVIFKSLRIDRSPMSWKQYALHLLLVNACLVAAGYLILRLQSVLFLNPNQIGNMEESLSFNTIISFMTNTNLQHYSGESGLTYFSQMAVIIMMMFTSAASGYAACVAMVRGLLGQRMGNFYEDFTRITTRFLIPAALLVGLFLVWQGVPQTLASNITVTTLEGKFQNLARGPIAALESIKHLGTNGGGFLGANSSTPLENPTILTNLAELYSMMILPAACVVTFGRMAYDTLRQRKAANTKISLSQTDSACGKGMGKEGRTIFLVMSLLFLLGLGLCFWSESQGNFAVENSGIVQPAGNMEGKEVRFGIAQSSLFTTVTTSFTTGTVNNMHDTLTPMGGLVPLLHMMLNVVFGGAGVGLMNMLVYVIIAVFICGLMIGRTPEYLNKKIEGREMKLAALCLIIHPLLILGFSALAVACQSGLEGITNPGFHGLTQVLYEFSSSAANNGSGFEGLADNTLFWNVTTGMAMFFGRYISIVLQLGIAGSLMKKGCVSTSAGTLRTDTPTFAVVLVVVVYLFAALTFLPALALGPIAEALTLGI